MNKSLLVVGYTTRHVVASAFAAGYTVYAIDYFCDQDLIPYTADHLKFEELDELPSAIDTMVSQYHPDYIVTTSGAELLALSNRLGTPVDVARTFMDKEKTQVFFEKIGVPVPKEVSRGCYPAMAKTIEGAGGWRNQLVHSDNELETWLEFINDVPYILQEYIEGMPASVCCLVTPSRDAVVLATNQQILRGGEVCPFSFSGSVTPCSHPMAARMEELGKKIAAESGCVGCIGIDFVLTNSEAYAIEVNPRFQGTLATVELATGQNLFTLHKNACEGHLPEKKVSASKYAVRKVLTAKNDFTLNADLLPFSSFIADIPHIGTYFSKGDVLCSVIGCGKTLKDAYSSLDNNIRVAIQYIYQ